MELTGAQILVESLIEQGVDVIFGYPGGSAILIYDALWGYQDRIRHILTAHEQGASHAADGYSRSTGKVGVCLATSGPGATNLVTGIATAYLDSVPMIAITANVTRPLLGRDSFQEVDIAGVSVPITKHNFFVKDTNALAETVRKAFEVAVSGRPGPVLIDIPKDVTAELAEYIPAGPYERRAFPQPKESKIEKAIELLESAKKPVIYLGGGVISSGAETQVQELGLRLNAPLVSSTRGLSAIPDEFPLYLGMVGMHGTPVSNLAINESDVIVAIGARFSDRVIGKKEEFAKNAKIIHIDIDHSEMDKNIETTISLLGDAKEVVTRLLEKLPQGHRPQWAEYLEEYKQAHPLPGRTQPGGVDERIVLDVARKIMGPQGILVTDVGQHQMIAAQNYKFATPRTFLSSLGLGTMGYGVGAAIGAKVGNPEKPVLLITGDGCFHMNFNEIAVAVTEQIPMVVCVMNNQVLGMVRQWQKLFYEQRYSSTTMERKTDYVKLAEALGAKGMRIETDEQVEAVLEEAFAYQGPVVIDVVMDINEDVFPIIPPGGTHKDMMFSQ